MPTYDTFKIEFSTTLDNGTAVARVNCVDNDTEFKENIEYYLDNSLLISEGGNYVDNIAEFLLNKAKDILIAQRKKWRKGILNVYSDIDEDIK